MFSAAQFYFRVHLCRHNDVFQTVPVSSDCLNHLGIFGGNMLIVKVIKHSNEANLYVRDTPDGKTANFAEITYAKITLHNGNGWRRTYSRSAVSPFGVVVRIERDLKVRK